MTYTLGAKSLANLAGVHPVLVAVVKRAIQLTEQDFTVYEGVRTLERQKQLVAAGTSKTLDSMHIPAPDRLQVLVEPGFLGHAVDLVPWIDGRAQWDWDAIYPIASAVWRAADKQGVQDKLNYGGVWDLWANHWDGSTPEAVKRAVNAYTDRRRAKGRTAFLDGPHWQIGRLG